MLRLRRNRRLASYLLVTKSRIAEDDNNLTSRTGWEFAGSLRLAIKPEHIETFEVCCLLQLHLACKSCLPITALADPTVILSLPCSTAQS